MLINDSIIENNKKLIEKYPFLECVGSPETTWLDDLEPGWKIAFGENLCEELKEAINKEICRDFKIEQIKEKYGSLRFYASGYDYDGLVDTTICKYEELSRYICGHCGKIATKITRGWIYPLCDDCMEKVRGECSNIEDFYDFESYKKLVEEVNKIKTNYRKSDYWRKIV